MGLPVREAHQDGSRQDGVECKGHEQRQDYQRGRFALSSVMIMANICEIIPLCGGMTARYQ